MRGSFFTYGFEKEILDFWGNFGNVSNTKNIEGDTTENKRQLMNVKHPADLCCIYTFDSLIRTRIVQFVRR